MTSYRGRRLDGSVLEFHQAIDLLEADTVPESYYQLVMASRYRPPDEVVQGSGDSVPGLLAKPLALTLEDQSAHVDPPVRPGSRPARRGKTLPG